MKIGIIMHPYGEKKPAGLGRSILERTRALIEGDPKNEYVVFLKNEPAQRPVFSGTRWSICVLGGGFLWQERLRAAPRLDAYIFNTPTLPFFWTPPHSIVIAHDFAYIWYGWGSIRDCIRSAIIFLYHGVSLYRADSIVAVSEATKRDLIKLFRVPARKIVTIYSGFKRICNVHEEVTAVPENYFLFVGSLKKRKNPLAVLQAFEKFHRRRNDFSLVIVGDAHGRYYETMARFVGDHNLGHCVKFLDHISDSTLSYVYRHARAFVFPSLIEGFGFPVLEAMDCGIPVITSNRSSLTEVGGRAALLVDPHNMTEIADAMERVVSEEGLDKEMVRKGKEHTALFSWERGAEELLRVLISLQKKA